MGLDLVKGIVRNNLEYGVIEPTMSKLKIIQVGTLAFMVMGWDCDFCDLFHQFSFQLQFATEAAITIVRIDDMIKLTKEESWNEG